MILTTIPTMAAGGLTAFDATLVSTSIVLVFSLLVVLCLIIMLLGKFFDWVQKKANAAALDELNAPAPARTGCAARRKAGPRGGARHSRRGGGRHRGGGLLPGGRRRHPKRAPPAPRQRPAARRMGPGRPGPEYPAFHVLSTLNPHTGRAFSRLF